MTGNAELGNIIGNLEPYRQHCSELQNHIENTIMDNPRTISTTFNNLISATLSKPLSQTLSATEAFTTVGDPKLPALGEKCYFYPHFGQDIHMQTNFHIGNCTRDDWAQKLQEGTTSFQIQQ